MAIPKRKSLAGICGIPREPDRVYVKTFDEDGLERTYLTGGRYSGTFASMFA